MENSKGKALHNFKCKIDSKVKYREHKSVL